MGPRLRLRHRRRISTGAVFIRRTVVHVAAMPDLHHDDHIGSLDPGEPGFQTDRARLSPSKRFP